MLKRHNQAQSIQWIYLSWFSFGYFPDFGIVRYDISMPKLKVRSGKIGRRSSSPNQVNCWVFFSEPSKLLALFGIKQEVIGFSSLLACFECSILISLWFSAWFGKLSPKYRRRYSRIMFYGTVRFAVCLVAIIHWPAAPGERRLILQCSKLRLYRAHLRLKISRLWLKFV